MECCPEKELFEVEDIVEEESDIYNNDVEAARSSDSSVPCWSKQEVYIALPEFKEDCGPTGDILDLNDSSPNHFSKRYRVIFNPNEMQAIDESMIPFKGRSSLKQYIPNKPIKRGYKVWK
ncbi:hypothetical protein NPIL_346571 [Nephila pilipes]|uniref:PiggyBac transposable element-derived protein domain-containing protein n=1 Tax=Nephila pilipes TaxID=299642 RepID=A0A8X6T9X5_NEPPI|nr:hypothetical protein NPIL_346571 [Nephila pilipes]